VLRDGKGALIAEDDVEGFARSVLRLLSSPQLQNDLGHSALEYVKEWSADNLSSRMIEFYQDAVAGRGSETGQATEPAE
jgi:glycosyltransferase involved in cell wall biosynthesis